VGANGEEDGGFQVPKNEGSTWTTEKLLYP
jgi:hypothetical protein